MNLTAKDSHLPKISQEEQAAMLVSEGVASISARRYEQALAAFNRAIAIKPDFALAYFNRGVLHKELSDIDKMIADFKTAYALDPGHAEMLRNIAVFLLAQGKALEAVSVSQRCIEVDPDSKIAWLALLDSHYQLANDDSALKLCEHVVSKFPGDVEVAIIDALFVPHIAMSNAHIDEIRARIRSKLSALLAKGIKFSDPLKNIRHTTFYLPYQGRDNRQMADFLAQFYLKSCPALSYTAAHCKKPKKQASEKLRVGFVSPSMHLPTLNQFFLKLIEALKSRDDIEPWIFSCAPAFHPEVLKIKNNFPNYVDLPMDFSKACELISGAAPDILIYMEVGSHQLMYALPFARLARVQVATGGFPVTTGIPNMDYFISNVNSETMAEQGNYSEKLVLFEHLCGVMERPKISMPEKTRADLGLPDDGRRLYACPAQLFKLHPDMDAVFAKILARDPQAMILLFDMKTNLMQNALLRRFANTMPPEYLQRIAILPYVSKEDFPHMLRVVDAVIDSFHFSFGTVAYIAIAAGVPLITWPGPYMCGRGAYTLLRKIGVTELIAKDHDEYVELALKLAQDKEFYRSTAEKLKARGNVFFEDYAAVDEFTASVKKFYAEAP